jgi:hypothetical protein
VGVLWLVMGIWHVMGIWRVRGTMCNNKMGNDFDSEDLTGMIIQNAIFLLGLLLILVVELVEHRSSSIRRTNITNFNTTSRISHSEDDFLVSMRENIIKRTVA